MAALAALAGSSVLGQEKQTAPPAAQPSAQVTNSNKGFETRGLKDFEQSIFKPFRSLEPEGSLDAVMQQPQQPPPVVNKRAKEAMERRRDWAFMTPEEILNGKSADDPANPQGSGKDD